MKVLVCRAFALALSLLIWGYTSQVFAEEPNETFADATILSPGVLTVSDDLFPGEASFPDTLMGAFGSFGNLIEVDDDDSLFGDGLASGLFDIPVNINNNIEFWVTGFGDDFFSGDHGELGEYEAVIEVFNFNGGLEDAFSVFGSLEPGVVDEYDFSDPDWLGGTYTVNLDNTLGSPIGGDVDFFTFTGLTPGAMFSAETLSVGSIDTLLGWYDDLGNELEVNDDFNEINFLSQIQGTVPASGQLTFGVTGFGDDFFEGAHIEQEVYDLQLTIDGANLHGDFEGDGDVDIFDLTNPTLGWEARYGIDLDGQDYLVWQQEFGNGTLVASVAVPEPCTALLLLAGMAVAWLPRQSPSCSAP